MTPTRHNFGDDDDTSAAVVRDGDAGLRHPAAAAAARDAVFRTPDNTTGVPTSADDVRHSAGDDAFRRLRSRTTQCLPPMSDNRSWRDIKDGGERQRKRR